MDSIIEEATKEICSIAGIGAQDTDAQRKIAVVIANAIAQDKKALRERLSALWGEGVA